MNWFPVPLMTATALGVAAGLALALPLTARTWAGRIVEPITVPPTYLAAGVIAAIGAHWLRQARYSLATTASPLEVPARAPARPARTVAVFVALTAIQPIDDALLHRARTGAC